MTKVRVKFDIKKIKRSDHERIAERIVSEMKRLIATGRSPVKDIGRFVQYAAVRKSNKTSYPFNVRDRFPSKAKTPVNLKLSGEFLDTLGYKATSKGSEIGHIDPDARTRELFDTHNEGKNKNVPKRKYLPNKRGEEFTVSIMRLIVRLYSDTIKKIIS